MRLTTVFIALLSAIMAVCLIQGTIAQDATTDHPPVSAEDKKAVFNCISCMKVMHFIADRLLAHPKPIGAGPAALHPNVRPVIHEEYVNKTIDIVCKDIKDDHKTLLTELTEFCHEMVDSHKEELRALVFQNRYKPHTLDRDFCKARMHFCGWINIPGDKPKEEGPGSHTEL